ncbi:MAG: XTP/dITP diphosphohydrolase [Maricaulis sp.]|jgi:XTP/dITP diphosphohydrolase
MSEQISWVLASHNAGKIKELEALLAPCGIALKGAAELGLDEPDETEPTFEGNAALKARAAWKATGLTSLSDDSGLSVDALGGEPGVLSARWAGPGRDFDLAMRRVHEALEARSAVERTARFVCVVALCQADGAISHYRGEVAGEIVWPPRGAAGFGYDAIFQPHGHQRTFAEMDAAEKRAMSHRGRALAALLAAEFGR